MIKTLAHQLDQAEITRRLNALRRDSVSRWGRMSAHQMVCHLTDAYRMLTCERNVPVAGSPLPRSIMKCVALYVPVRWPTGIRTPPELDQEIGGTSPVNFDADVAALRALLERIAVERRGSLGGLVHPIFGPMSEAAWLRWAYLHADHHLRQFGL